MMRVSPAVLGFLGVVIRALISVGAQLLIETRRERRARERERNTEQLSVRQAARLIDAEFEIAGYMILLWMRNGMWGTDGPSIGSWESYGPTLAGRIDLRAWQLIVRTVKEIEYLDSLREMQLSSGQLHLDADAGTLVQNEGVNIAQARTALKRLLE